ncbi:hypothetical protein CEE45_09475 [Candidatus Heimdallarchaeota archaeon B3_Heim]|nr:MAG: hypothetical protein CEE45_09475 [Candidatus Heimdallarchaeota archaeon B3_Heim]
MKVRGHCPFRVEILEHLPGCVLQKGKESLCYSTDERPLIARDSSYYCPLLPKVIVSDDLYKKFEQLVSYILTIQDRESTTINIWPMLTGIANSCNKAKTPEGKAMERLSMKVREELNDIIFEME